MPVTTAAIRASAPQVRPERLIVSLRVNNVAEGDAVIVCVGRDIYVRARDFSGVHFGREPAVRTIAGDVYDSLASTGIAYTYDPAALTLELRYRVATAQRIVVPVAAPPLFDRNSSATLSFSGTLVHGTAPEISELGTLAVPGGIVHVGFSNGDSAVFRSELAAAFYERDENGEILAGDQAIANSSLSALPVFGLGMTRGTLVRTSGRRAPYERLAGNSRDPTAIQIEIAGEQPIEIGLEPGAFSIDGVPINARVSAVDQVTLLPVQVIALPPLDSQLIAPGWHESAAALGLPRTCIYACDRYHGLAAGGYVLVGNSLFLASGAHAEYVDGRAGAGYDLVDSDPNHAFHLSAGLGPLDGVLVSYEQRAGALSFGAGYDVNGAPIYDDAGRLVLRARTVAQTLNAEYRRLRFEYQLEAWGKAGDARTYDVIDVIPVHHSAVRLDLRERLVHGAGGGLSLGVRYLLAMHGGRETSALGVTLGAHPGPAAELSSQLDMPSGIEIGADASGVLRAAYSSNAIEIAASEPGIVTIYGAIAFLHGAHFVRETAGGYAVAIGRNGDVVDDSDGRAHPIGAGSSAAFPIPETDRPTTLSYRQQRVTVDDEAALSVPQVFPAPGAGSLVVISHRRLFAVIGTITGPQWHFGTMMLPNGASSPIGADGEFYFEGLSAGAYAARVSGTSGSCVATIAVPVSSAAQVNVGAIACRSVLRRRHCDFVADPLQSRDVKELCKRIEPPRIQRAHLRELAPRRIRIAQRVTCVAEPLVGAIEIVPVDPRVVRCVGP